MEIPGGETGLVFNLAATDVRGRLVPERGRGGSPRAIYLYVSFFEASRW